MNANSAISVAAPTDAELVARSLVGNSEAFGQIVARYQSLICSLAYSAWPRNFAPGYAESSCLYFSGDTPRKDHWKRAILSFREPIISPTRRSCSERGKVWSVGYKAIMAFGSPVRFGSDRRGVVSGFSPLKFAASGRDVSGDALGLVSWSSRLVWGIIYSGIGALAHGLTIDGSIGASRGHGAADAYRPFFLYGSAWSIRRRFREVSRVCAMVSISCRRSPGNSST